MSAIWSRISALSLLAVLSPAVLAVLGPAQPRAAAQPAPAAESMQAVGWWTRRPGAEAPEGGVAVGLAPDGATSVAAIRTAEGLVDAVLVLTPASSFLGEFAALKVCHASADWKPAAGGPLEQAPEARCEQAEAAFVQDEAGRWRAPMAELLAHGTSVIVLPREDSSGVSLFELQFEAPAIEAVRRAADGAKPATPEPTLPPSTDRGASFPPLVGGDRALPQPTPAPPPPDTAGPELEPSDATPPSRAGDLAAPPPRSMTGRGRTVAEGVALAILSVLAGVLAGAGRWLWASRMAQVQK